MIENTTTLIGSIAEPLGEFRFIRGKLIIDVDFTPHHDIRNAIQEDQLTIETLRKNAEVYSSSERSPQMPTLMIHLRKKLRSKTEMVAKKLKGLTDSLWLRSGFEPSLNRSKRGLVNAGGELLKTLFGTATNEELQQIKHKVEVFSYNLNAINRNHKGVLHDLQDNHDRIKVNTANLKKLHNVVCRTS